MDWGFYCRTCGLSSGAWFDTASGPLEAVEVTAATVESLSRGAEARLPMREIRVLEFLAVHSGHDLWAECETGVLRLAAGRAPARRSGLPRFAQPGPASRPERRLG